MRPFSPFGNNGRNNLSKKVALKVELLEDRVVPSSTVLDQLTASANGPHVDPQWFAVVTPTAPDSGGTIGSQSLGTQSTSSTQTGPIAVFDWIVQFDSSALHNIHSVAETSTLLSDPRVSFDVLRGLGGVGQVLVRSTGAPSHYVFDVLASNPNIASFDLDGELLVHTVPNDPSYSKLWGLENGSDKDMDASQAWSISTGSKSVIAAVVDSGVDYNHPDLKANMWKNPGEIAGNGKDDDGNGFIDDVYGWDFVNNDSNPMDDHGHGTHVAGTIGAVGNNGVGVTGVNWNVSIMALKFVSSSGSGKTSNAISALNYATMMRNQFGQNVRVTNNSWGGAGYSSSLYSAIQAGGNAGILFVGAAGNSSNNNDTNPFYPASYNSDYIISVAATTSTDSLAGFSNYGATSVDVAAPGSSIYSTTKGGGYGYMSGTSMAAPHVAGLAALAWSVKSSASVTEIRNAILGGVDKVGSLTGKVATGGRINAYKTLASLAGNLPPKANADIEATVTGTPITLNVLANDTDPNNDPLSITSVSSPSHGTAVINSNQTVTYTPQPGFQGVDTFTYSIKDNKGGVATGTVTIHVNANAELVWMDDSVPAGAALLTSGGDSWKWVTSNPAPISGSKAHQSEAVAGEHQHYFQNATETLTVREGDSLFVYVYIDPANVPESLMIQWNDGTWDHRAYWGANKFTLGVDGTDSRRYMGPMPTSGQWVRLEVPASKVGLEGRTINGMAFTLYGGRATWDKAGRSKATTSVNRPPVAQNDSATTKKDTPVKISVLANDSDPDKDVLTITSVSGASNGTTVVNSDGTITYTPKSGFVGSDTFNYTIADGRGGTDSASVTVSVQAASEVVWVDDTVPTGATLYVQNGDDWHWVSGNPNPVSGTKAHQSVLKSGLHQHYFDDAANTITVKEGDRLFAYVYLDPANVPEAIMLQWNDGTWDHRAYWGANKFTWGVNGTASRYRIGALPVAGQWVRLEVPASLVGLEGKAIKGMAFTLYGGRATWDKAGVVSSGDTANRPPVAAHDVITTTNGVPTNINVLANDSDPDGDSLVVVSVGNASYGMTSVNADGTIKYTPNSGFAGVDTFTYTISDGRGGSATATVTVTVTNEAEVIWFDDSAPTGATLHTQYGDVWKWITSNPSPVSGTKAHQSALKEGLHQHYFLNASQTLKVSTGDTLFAYVYLDPANMPTSIMLQWNDGTWDHRAYWGPNVFTWGVDGTASRLRMGDLPVGGQWVRLEVPARLLGLEGKTLNGMAFTLYGGRATWDKAGKIVDASTAESLNAFTPQNSVDTPFQNHRAQASESSNATNAIPSALHWLPAANDFGNARSNHSDDGQSRSGNRQYPVISGPSTNGNEDDVAAVDAAFAELSSSAWTSLLSLGRVSDSLSEILDDGFMDILK